MRIQTQTILLTGGTGFIGSHTAVELIEAGYDIIIVDNLSNSSIDVIDNINKIVGKDSIDPDHISEFYKTSNKLDHDSNHRSEFYNCDINDTSAMDDIFINHNIDTVIHFAAYKSVGESVSNPLKYYKNNIGGLINLLEIMTKHNVKKIIFSSSATVYGIPEVLPITESSKLSAINPYGRTKLYGENILQDLSVSDPSFQIIILRYFNPVGAHKSGLIGENPLDTPSNLFPYILDVIKGKREHLNIFGNDYITSNVLNQKNNDGTAIRDYIHVVDLSQGHVKSIENLTNGVKIYNLGTGVGYSVLEIVNKFSEHYPVKYNITDRREGDAPEVYADCSLAKEELGWEAQKGLDDMVRDSLIGME